MQLLARIMTEMFFKCRNLLIILMVACAFAQAQGVQYSIIESNSHGLTMQVDFHDYAISPVPGTLFQRLEMPEAYPIEAYGEPELLKNAFSLIVPEDARPTATIIHAAYDEYSDIDLVPSKGRLSRSVNPESVNSQKGPSYLKDCFLYEDSVFVGEPYKLRDYYGVSIHCFPFAYNPVRKCLKVFSSITVKVEFNGSGSVEHFSTIEKAFDPVYGRHFLNYSTTKSSLLEENGKILVLTPKAFYPAMLPYVEWKTKMGFPTEMVCLEDIGAGLTYIEVKNFIKEYYHRKKMSYVILVGDNLLCPPVRLYGNYSDNYYAELDGEDHYPDVILGRISAETIEDVHTQVRRFMEYEQNPIQTAHFPVFCGIASSEGPGDEGEYDYTHIRNIDNLLQRYSYTSGFELFDGSRKGLDKEGDPTPELVYDALNQGVGIINYCGHGSAVSWKTSSFGSQHIADLNNVGKLPLIISVACENGLYVNRTCFAESWMRATRDGEPVGAVSVLMSTIDQPWRAPMCAQDWMMKLLTGSDNAARQYTLGGIIFNGLIKMLDTYDDYSVSRTWLLFGDPTLAVRTAVPQKLEVNHNKELLMTSSSLDFSSPVEHARIVLSLRNQIIAAGNIQDGSLTLSWPETLTPTDTLVMLATAPDYIPLEDSIPVVVTDGPYVSLQKIEIRDRNRNCLAEHGESVYLNAFFHNYGIKTAEHCTAVLSSDDPYVTITNGQHSMENIPADSVDVEIMAFSFRVAENVPAAHRAHFYMNTDCGACVVKDAFDILLYAPQPVIQSIYVNDSGGNNNNSLDRGETVILECTLMNAGNGNSDAGNAKIIFPDGKMRVVSRYQQQIPVLKPSGQYVMKVKAKVREDVEPDSRAMIQVQYQTGEYQTDKDFLMPVSDDFLVGVAEFTAEEIAVYPNPASDYVFLKIPEEINNGKGMVQYQIFDTFGRLLEQASVKGSTSLVSMQYFAKGVYFLKVVDDKNELKTFKIIKQ